MRPAHRPDVLTSREWGALVDDTGRLIEDLELGFGPDHVVVSRAKDLVRRIIEALERAYDALPPAPAAAPKGGSNAEARSAQAQPTER